MSVGAFNDVASAAVAIWVLKLAVLFNVYVSIVAGCVMLLRGVN